MLKPFFESRLFRSTPITHEVVFRLWIFGWSFRTGHVYSFARRVVLDGQEDDPERHRIWDENRVLAVFQTPCEVSRLASLTRAWESSALNAGSKGMLTTCMLVCMAPSQRWNGGRAHLSIHMHMTMCMFWVALFAHGHSPIGSQAHVVPIE